MRIFRHLIPFCTILFVVSCSEQPVGNDGVIYKSALQYNHAIIDNQAKFVRKYMDILNKTEVPSEQTLIELKKLSTETSDYAETIADMPAYKGDSLFRNAGVELLNFYSNFLLHDFSKIVKMRMVAGDSVVHQYTDSINILMQKNTELESVLDQKFQHFQKEFALKNGFKLSENRLERKN